VAAHGLPTVAMSLFALRIKANYKGTKKLDAQARTFL
jgi:hypothetical protein